MGLGTIFFFLITKLTHTVPQHKRSKERLGECPRWGSFFSPRSSLVNRFRRVWVASQLFFERGARTGIPSDRRLEVPGSLGCRGHSGVSWRTASRWLREGTTIETVAAAPHPLLAALPPVAGWLGTWIRQVLSTSRLCARSRGTCVLGPLSLCRAAKVASPTRHCT